MVTNEQFQEYRDEVRDGFKRLDDKIDVLFEQHMEQHKAEAEQIKHILGKIEKLDGLEANMREVKADMRIVKNRLNLP